MDFVGKTVFLARLTVYAVSTPPIDIACLHYVYPVVEGVPFCFGVLAGARDVVVACCWWPVSCWLVWHDLFYVRVELLCECKLLATKAALLAASDYRNAIPTSSELLPC